jgi:hypothetical protein
MVIISLIAAQQVGSRLLLVGPDSPDERKEIISSWQLLPGLKAQTTNKISNNALSTKLDCS